MKHQIPLKPDAEPFLLGKIKERLAFRKKKRFLVKVYLVFTTSHFPWLTMNLSFSHIRGFFNLLYPS